MNRKELFVLALIIFLTVVAWIAFGIYHANSTSTKTEKELREVVPLTPIFDHDIIDSIEKRER